MDTAFSESNRRKGGEVGMRLIDADALKIRIIEDAPGLFDGGSSITKAFILAMLESRNATPTIDAVEIVRCKDCKHSKRMCQPWYDLVCEKHGNANTPDWFCGDGKRRDDDA